jgi:putative transposase
MALRFPIALVLSVICLAAPAWADFQAGMDAYNGRDYATALRERRPLAEQGDPRAQFRLGLLYENGNGVPRDFAKARHMAQARQRFGFRRIHLLLRREGWMVNKKRVHRIYREEGLTVRLRRRQKRASHLRMLPPQASQVNERWSMDFVADTLLDGR